MNYVGELINHIDRQMSSTTQNNEQKEKAVNYIEKIESILEDSLPAKTHKNKIKSDIEKCLKKSEFIGIAEEITRAMNSDKSRGNSTYYYNTLP